MANKKSSNKKMTAAQREAKMQAAKEREKRAQAQREHKERMKRVFIVVITVILVIGLTLPIAGLTLMGSN